MARGLLLSLLCSLPLRWEPSLRSATATGLDYTDGGSYLVDGNSQNNFSFKTSVFYGQ